jgi:hypothetical protein
LEQKNECFEESLEIVNIVEASAYLNVLEEAHPEDSKNEHDEEEKQADVEEGWHGHDEGEEEGADAFGTLYEPQDTTDLEEKSVKKITGKVFFTFATLTTLSRVGLTKYFSIRSLRNRPA